MLLSKKGSCAEKTLPPGERPGAGPPRHKGDGKSRGRADMPRTSKGYDRAARKTSPAAKKSKGARREKLLSIIAFPAEPVNCFPARTSGRKDNKKAPPLPRESGDAGGCRTICFSAVPLREGTPSAPGVQGHCAYDADKPCRLSARQLWAWRSPLRILTRWILPETVLGNSSANSTMRGYL